SPATVSWALTAPWSAIAAAPGWKARSPFSPLRACCCRFSLFRPIPEAKPPEVAMRTHAIRFARTGGPEVLSWEEVEVGDPAPGQVLLRQTAVGLNYIDTYHRSGLYKIELPSGLGTEGAGVVEKIGANVSELAIGDRVAYSSGPLGAYSKHR